MNPRLNKGMNLRRKGGGTLGVAKEDSRKGERLRRNKMNRKRVDRECLRSVPCNFVIDIVVGNGDDGVRQAFVRSGNEFSRV